MAVLVPVLVTGPQLVGLNRMNMANAYYNPFYMLLQSLCCCILSRSKASWPSNPSTPCK